MNEEAKERKADTSTSFRKSDAHELCKKAKEALEKANKLLAESGKPQDRAKQSRGENRP